MTERVIRVLLRDVSGAPRKSIKHWLTSVCADKQADCEPVVHTLGVSRVLAKARVSLRKRHQRIRHLVV
jgi:hypothetical protein